MAVSPERAASARQVHRCDAGAPRCVLRYPRAPWPCPLKGPPRRRGSAVTMQLAPRLAASGVMMLGSDAARSDIPRPMVVSPERAASLQRVTVAAGAPRFGAAAAAAVAATPALRALISPVHHGFPWGSPRRSRFIVAAQLAPRLSQVFRPVRPLLLLLLSLGCDDVYPTVGAALPSSRSASGGAVAARCPAGSTPRPPRCRVWVRRHV
jgi:hypothetical protein